MSRGRKAAPGQVYYLGRLRFRPGLDPPELVALLETICQADPPQRANLLRAALLGGAKQVQAAVAAGEDQATTRVLDEMFADF